jgi:hypothetical protein
VDAGSLFNLLPHGEIVVDGNRRIPALKAGNSQGIPLRRPARTTGSPASPEQGQAKYQNAEGNEKDFFHFSFLLKNISGHLPGSMIQVPTGSYDPQQTIFYWSVYFLIFSIQAAKKMWFRLFLAQNFIVHHPGDTRPNGGAMDGAVSIAIRHGWPAGGAVKQPVKGCSVSRCNTRPAHNKSYSSQKKEAAGGPPYAPRRPAGIDFPGFCFAKNLKAKTGRDAVFRPRKG